MSVWEITEDANTYCSILPTDNDWNIFYSLSGEPLHQNWKAPEVFVLHEEGKIVGDFFWLTGGVLSLRGTALQKLTSVLNHNVQILPLKFSKFELYVINVLAIFDCLDYERSTIERFPSSGRIMYVERYVFKENCLVDASIFRLPELKSRLFATETFKDAVDKFGLTGLTFRKIAD